eukprot:scaffold179589_cov30-Tisochrysis_lutea.AAC.7
MGRDFGEECPRAGFRVVRKNLGSLSAANVQVANLDSLELELGATCNQLRADWDKALHWLKENGFVNPSPAPKNNGASGTSESASSCTSSASLSSASLAAESLTPRGRACAAFADGQPLIMGTIISDGWLAKLTLPEVCAWICLFLRERRLQMTAMEAVAEMPPFSPEMQARGCFRMATSCAV